MKINYQWKQVLIVLLQTIIISLITIISVIPISCKITAEGLQLLSGDFNPPILNSFSVIDSKTLKLCFSEKVTLSENIIKKVNEDIIQNEISIDNEKDFNDKINTQIEYCEDSNDINIFLNDETLIGEKYLLYATVEDHIGNTLSFSIKFTGYNSHVPKIIMTEIKTISDTSQNKFEKENNYFRNEFVEFLALTDGNLSGLEIVSANDGEEKKYTFPPINVKKGEIFVVHLRNRGDGCVSELENDLNLSSTTYTSLEIRDLWSDNTETVFGNKTDIILLKNSANNEILDGIMYKDKELEDWPKKYETFLIMLENANIYESTDCTNSIISEGVTGTKNLHRKDAALIYEKILNNEEINYPLKQKSDSWYVSSATAGLL